MLSRYNNPSLLEKAKGICKMVYPQKITPESLTEDDDIEERINERIFRSDLEIAKGLFIIAIENFDESGTLISNLTVTRFRSAN